MHYVILRDDDTNALTPVECLDRLYRPFLERKLPVNLAVIPCVRTHLLRADGAREEFVYRPPDHAAETIPIGMNSELVRYLQSNAEYRIVQHGCNHDLNEFDNLDHRDLELRIQLGTSCLVSAGFARPTTFVAPYDKLSPAAFQLAARHFNVISTGWFELRRLPKSWWPQYTLRKLQNRSHWQVGPTTLLGHPGCLLSYMKPHHDMLENVRRAVASQAVTVLVTHWWEYFRGGQPDEPFIEILHQVADFLEEAPDVRVISFEDLVAGDVPLN